MPSIFESYGIAVAEAMSYGKAIVATNVGGLPEVVKEGGLLCRPKDPNDLADKINTILRDQGMRENMARISHALAQSYTWDSLTPKIDNAYLDILNR